MTTPLALFAVSLPIACVNSSAGVGQRQHTEGAETEKSGTYVTDFPFCRPMCLNWTNSTTVLS